MESRKSGGGGTLADEGSLFLNKIYLIKKIAKIFHHKAQNKQSPLTMGFGGFLRFHHVMLNLIQYPENLSLGEGIIGIDGSFHSPRIIFSTSCFAFSNKVFASSCNCFACCRIFWICSAISFCFSIGGSGTLILSKLVLFKYKIVAIEQSLFVNSRLNHELK